MCMHIYMLKEKHVTTVVKFQTRCPAMAWQCVDFRQMTAPKCISIFWCMPQNAVEHKTWTGFPLEIIEPPPLLHSIP